MKSDQDQDDGSSLGRGQVGKGVRELQEALTAANFPPGPADGVFGPATAGAVVALQQSLGLRDDGVVGPTTRSAVDRAAKAGPELLLWHRNPYDPSQRHRAPCTPES